MNSEEIEVRIRLVEKLLAEATHVDTIKSLNRTMERLIMLDPDDIPMSERRFSFVVAHTGDKPLGDEVPGEHAAFTMLTVWSSGPKLDELKLHQGGHRRRSVTADGTHVEKRKTHRIEYNITRVK